VDTNKRDHFFSRLNGFVKSDYKPGCDSSSIWISDTDLCLHLEHANYEASIRVGLSSNFRAIEYLALRSRAFRKVFGWSVYFYNLQDPKAEAADFIQKLGILKNYWPAIEEA